MHTDEKAAFWKILCKKRMEYTMDFGKNQF